MLPQSFVFIKNISRRGKVGVKETITTDKETENYGYMAHKSPFSCFFLLLDIMKKTLKSVRVEGDLS